MSSPFSFAAVVALSLYGVAFAGAGCSSICSSTSKPIASGSYVINPAGYDHFPNEWQGDNYLLTLSSDRKSVDEEFDLDGKHYHLKYVSAVHSQTNRN